MLPPPRCIEPHSFTHRYGAGGAMGQCCPASAPPPHPRGQWGWGSMGQPPPHAALDPILYGAGGFMGRLCSASGPNTQPNGGGGAMGQPPCIQPPSLIPIWGRGALWGSAAPLLDPPHPNGGSMGQCCPTSAPRYPGGGVVGRPPPSHPTPLLSLYGAAGAMGQPPPPPPPRLWGKTPPPGCP